MLPHVARDCRAFDPRGYTGRKLSDFLWLLNTGSNTLQRSVGLACANAVLNCRQQDSPERDAIELMHINSADRVCMVGRFPPLVSRVKQAGAALSILETGPSRTAALSKKLHCCHNHSNHYIESHNEGSFGKPRSPRHVAVLGPSTPLCPEASLDTPVNHLGGSIVKDPGQVMRIVSEAGGGAPR